MKNWGMITLAIPYLKTRGIYHDQQFELYYVPLN